MISFKTESFYFFDARSQRINRPQEDFSLIQSNIFAVFDGVTRLFQEPYPNPSPAFEASQIAAKTIASVIQEGVLSNQNNLDLLRAAFRQANLKIKQYNNSLGVTPSTVNHLERQYAATVGSFGFIAGRTLYFGQINDSGAMIFDSFGNREIDLSANQTFFVKYLTHLETKGDFRAGSKEEHVFVRSKIVNNTQASFDGRPIRFGVMTGQKEAENFLRVGSLDIEKGQIAIFYTDGFLPFVFDEEFIKMLFVARDQSEITRYVNHKEALGEKFQKEKTMIVVHFP